MPTLRHHARGDAERRPEHRADHQDDHRDLEATRPEGELGHRQAHVALVRHRRAEHCDGAGLGIGAPPPRPRRRAGDVHREHGHRDHDDAADVVGRDLRTRDRHEDQCGREEVEDRVRERVDRQAEPSPDHPSDRRDQQHGRDDLQQDAQHGGRVSRTAVRDRLGHASHASNYGPKVLPSAGLDATTERRR